MKENVKQIVRKSMKQSDYSEVSTNEEDELLGLELGLGNGLGDDEDETEDNNDEIFTD